ncbi:MAG TPA: protein kinase [Kofleriaceae bacterium]|nr:protein kinase [Kofleriaceae bacterium]
MAEGDAGVDPFSATLAPGPKLAAGEVPERAPAGTTPQSPRALGQKDEPLSGRRLAHFHIEKKLGQGGMGAVYLATDVALERPVAVKVLSRNIADNPDLRERFYREARAQARIQHPHVCHIYYIGEEDGQLFFAMEYVDGESLQERLDRTGKLSPGEAVELCRMAAAGLREAHRHGFSHRDIKPSNLMVDKNGQVKIVDFGIAKQSGDGAGPALTKEGPGTIIGTPLYMAPEQARGEAIDFRADIYALGATLHHLIAGAPPFEGKSDLAVISQHLSDSRPRLAPTRRLGRQLEPVDLLCDRMMAKRPEDRFASYDALIAAMDQASPLRSRPAGFWVRSFASALDVSAILLLLVAAKVPLSHYVRDIESWGQLLDAVAITAYVCTCQLWWKKTLGKRLLELEIVSMSGGPPAPAAMLVRFAAKWGPWALFSIYIAVVSIVGTEPSGWWSVPYAASMVLPILAGMVATWRSPRKRTVWDRLAKTEVRYAANRR